MLAHHVFCSHCGLAQPQTAPLVSFILHCPECEGVTINLGCDWNGLGQTGDNLQDDEFACRTCDTTFSMELIIRSESDPCERCIQIGDVTMAATSETQRPSSLTPEELAFLGQASN